MEFKKILFVVTSHDQLGGEESGAQLDKIVPFLLEDMLRSRGANYQKGESWLPFVTREGKLITGQNPASSVLAAQTVLDLFERMK